MKCLQFGVPTVSGSTGWNNKIEKAISYCKENNGSFLQTSNFSIGVNIFFEVNKMLAKLMASQPEYDVTMREIHHTAKKDAPSGTAVTLAEQILTNLPRKKNWINEPAKNQEQLAIISERIDPIRRGFVSFSGLLSHRESAVMDRSRGTNPSNASVPTVCATGTASAAAATAAARGATLRE